MEGKSIKQIKREDYRRLVELVGKERADEVFRGDEDLKDDTKYPIKEINYTIWRATIKRFIIVHPVQFLIGLGVVFLFLWIVYYKMSFYW
jgi:hypothetical protein